MGDLPSKKPQQVSMTSWVCALTWSISLFQQRCVWLRDFPTLPQRAQRFVPLQHSWKLPVQICQKTKGVPCIFHTYHTSVAWLRVLPVLKIGRIFRGCVDCLCRRRTDR